MTGPAFDPLLDELRTIVLTVPVPPRCSLSVEADLVDPHLEGYENPGLVDPLALALREHGLDPDAPFVVYRLKLCYSLAGRTFVGMGDLPGFLAAEASAEPGQLGEFVAAAADMLARTVRGRALALTRPN